MKMYRGDSSYKKSLCQHNTQDLDLYSQDSIQNLQSKLKTALIFFLFMSFWNNHLGEPDEQDKFVTGPDDTIHDEDGEDSSIAPL